MKKTGKKSPGVRVRVKLGKKAEKGILSAGEPDVYEIANIRGKGRYLIVCDHASNRIPKSLKNLGLKKADLEKHIAWDPGTADIGRYLAKALDATAVLAGYSRLVVDLNRGPDSAECMRGVSDHVRIPGNEKLTAAQKKERLKTFFWPYHVVIDYFLSLHTDKGVAPVLISIHSFTPEMDGFRRPWHIGVLWNREEKRARRLVQELRRRNPKLVIGENEPYSLKAVNFTKNTISTHAESQGLPYIIVEFRQDLVDTKKKADKWAKIFLDSLKPVLAEAGLHKLKKRARK